GRAPARPMTGSAKQSTHPLAEPWIASSLSLLAMTRSPPCRAVLLVLRLDGLARLGPVVIAPVAELVEIPAHREGLRAVHRNGLAIDPVAAAGDQEHREVLQFLHGADAAHRVHGLGARAGLVARLDAL